MTLTAILSAITIAAHYATLAVEVGQDVSPFLVMIGKLQGDATNGTKNVSPDDVANLHKMAQPFLDALNDTSRDV